jgi:TolA-binding protein
MTTLPLEPKDSKALDAFGEFVRDSVEPHSPAEIQAGLDSLHARLETGRRRGWLRWSLVGVAAAACLLLGLRLGTDVGRHLGAPGPGYRVEGGTVLEGGYMRESSPAGIKLFFDEGSKVELSPGTRARMRAFDAEGARVAVEHGTVAFQVVPGGHRRWLVEVGPFVVTVTGTVFTVSWDVSNERFELRLRHGRVVVSGPVTGGDIALRAGQRLRVNLPKAETVITEDGQEDEVVPSAAASVAAPNPAPLSAPAMAPSVEHRKPVKTVASPSPGPKPEELHRWTDELARGHWDRILDEVQRIGVDTALEKAPMEDLFALANAARYRRQTDLARSALLAERRRFPDSPRSLDALYLLGRVEETHAGGGKQAFSWYDEYLSRAPKGAYAAEALGRKMTLTSESGKADMARPMAEEYLRRFPRGSYAGSARALLRLP